MSGHAGNSGLQNHSIGESYPYAVVIVENAPSGLGRCEIRNLITGQTLASVGYRIGDDAQFTRANRMAEVSAVALRKRADAVATTQPAAEKTLYLCNVYAPALPAEMSRLVYPRFRQFLLETYGGYTVGAECRGVWRNPATGGVSNDSISVVSVAVDNPAEFCVRLAPWVAEFGQTCLFVVDNHNVAHFVYPPAAESGEIDAVDGRWNWFGEA